MRILSRWMTAAAGLAAALGAATPAPANAQTLASRIAAVRDGTVRFEFETRPEVCGDGSGSFYTNSRGDGWHGRPCIHGPMQIELVRSGGETVSLHDCIGCTRHDGGDPVVELGQSPPADAARYLIAAAPSLGRHAASQAIAAATFADGVDVSPELTALVKNADAPTDTRKNALFWLGQSDASTRDLSRLYDQLQPYELRKHFTFVLSQRRNDGPAIDKLIDIAQHDPDFQVRKQAMFWLGQTHDPKAIKFFQTILAR